MHLRSWIVLLALTASMGCATLGGKKHFSSAQKAEQQGDLATALREYQAAIDAQPNNQEYRTALDRAKTNAAESHANAARAAEAQEDWATAVSHWEAALKFTPSNDEMKARLELDRLRTTRSDPLEFFLATQKLAQALPGDSEAQRALEQARNEAFRYYNKLAETFFDAHSYSQAYESFESARKVKPDDEAFRGLKYRIARARYHEAAGDKKMKSGDHLAAFRAYEEAASFAELPGLNSKLERARRGAGSLIEQLEQARAFERLKKWEDAAELYTLLRDRSDAPQDVATAAQNARLESAKIRAERAATFATQGLADRATAAFALALEHTDTQPSTMALLHEGLEYVQVGQAGEALLKFQAAQKETPELPVHDAALKVAAAKAKSEFDAAKAIAPTDPAEAMLRVSRLAPFKASLSGYDQVRGQLVKRAFKVLLDRAERLAEDGEGARAAEIFGAALEIAKAPAEVQVNLQAGSAALKAGDYRVAEEAFGKVVAADKKSRLGQTGTKIAAGLRLSELRKEAAGAEQVEDALRAAAAYRQILEIKPDDESAKTGLEGLREALIAKSLAAADAHRAAGRPGSAYVYYRRVLDLDKLNAAANDAITQLSGSFELRPTPIAWVSPVRRGNRLGDACPNAEKDLRDRLILYLTRTRNLGAEYLQREPSGEIDEGKRPKPSIELLSALEHCAFNESGGRINVTIQMRVGNEALMTDKVGASFDPKTLPKDEAEAGIDADKVLDSILKETARLVAIAVQPHAAKLKDWRVTEARARMRANDDEGAAMSYAVFALTSEKLSASEREAHRELERYILNRLR